MKMKKLMSFVIASAMVVSAAVPVMAKDGDPDHFYIGAIGPKTGAAANYGLGVCNAGELAVEEINAAGGINGYQVEYRSEDDELDNEKSVNAYNTLKDWGMQILVGPTTSGCSIAVSEETLKDNMFQITPSGSAQDCTLYDNVFRVCFSDPNQGAKSAEYISANGLATKVGIIYDSSDVYSSGIEATFEAEAANQGIEIAVKEAFTADSSTDFSSQIQKCKDAEVELVFLPIYYTQAGTILTQASAMGLETKWFGCDGLDGMLNMDNFDTALAEGGMFLTPFIPDAEDELTQNFVKNYTEKYKDAPNQFGADSYDAVYALKAAIEKADLTPEASVSDICEALKTTMTEIEFDGLTGADMSWTPEGEPNKDPKAVIIKDGKYSSMA